VIDSFFGGILAQAADAGAPAAAGGSDLGSSLAEGIIGQLPWLLIFVIFFILPAVMRSQRNASIERAFARIQKKRKSRLIALVHRDEPMGFLGIPMLRYIDMNDAEDILEAIRRTPANQPLEIVLHTPGGLVLSSLQIARAIKAHKGKKTVYVPHYAMSGGTLIALAADEIVLNRHAVLGPIDPQIGGLPAASILRVAQTKSADAVDDYTLVLADLSRKAIDQLEAAAKELLAGTVSPNAAANIAELLSSGRWTHDYPIEADEAREIGLNVRTEVPGDIMELISLFPATVRRTGAKWLDSASALFSRPKRAAPRIDRHIAEATPFTGYQPGPGARSFSYGPWDPRDLRPQGSDPGPGYRDLREDRSIRRR
jgi:ClpP class serine protease